MGKSPQPSPERYVWSLIQGQESDLKLDLLLSLTSLTSEPVTNALREHYIKGTAQKMCEMKYSISQQAFSRAAKRLNEVYEIVQQLNDVK